MRPSIALPCGRGFPTAFVSRSRGPQTVIRSHAMPNADRTAAALTSRVWWYLVLLAMQSFAIGLAASLLLGLAVFAVA
jgi:hypothetical protein